jgi:hypothetical protein
LLPYEAACWIPPTGGGFNFGGERIPLINPQRWIFKPRRMEHLLSIKTVFPRRGARVWYDDQREAHRQIYVGNGVVDYQFMGTDPNSADNAGFWMQCSGRHPSSISSTRRRVGITRSFRRSSWDGTPIGYESISHSG